MAAAEGVLTFAEYVKDYHYLIDDIICRGQDYSDSHPEIYGVAFSPQAERGWGTWWMWRAYDRIVKGEAA